MTQDSIFTSHKPAFADLPSGIKSNIQQWQELNSQFNYRYFSDSDTTQWLHSNLTDEQIHCYHALNTGAGRADFFRIFYLARNGGIWHDADLPALGLVRNLPSFPSLSSTHRCILFNNRKAPGFRYTLIFSRRGCKLMEDLSERICHNIKRELSSQSGAKTIEITGPCALGSLINLYCNKSGLTWPIQGSSFTYLGDQVYYSPDIVDEADTYQEENTIAGYINELKDLGVAYHAFENAVKPNYPG